MADLDLIAGDGIKVVANAGAGTVTVSAPFTQAGTGAVERSSQERARQVIYASDMYSAAQKADVAAGTALVDVTTALLSAIAQAKNIIAPHFIVDPGVHLVSDTVQFDLPDHATITFLGRLRSTVANKSALIIGKAGGNTACVTATGIKVERSTNDYTGTSVGVELLNLAWSSVDIRRCTGFRVGVKAHGNGFGFTYNNISLGHIHDNRTNVQLAVSNSAGGGYCNECNWLGGSLNHTSTYDVAANNGVNLEITHDATHPINNHRFYGISFEDAHPSSTNTVAAILNGQHNVLFWPRLERISGQSTYEIQFTANSIRNYVVGNPFQIQATNINDAGSQSGYQTLEGLHLWASTPNDANKGLLDLRSLTSNAARLILLREASTPTVRGFLDASGLIEMRNMNLTNLGNYASDAAAAAGGVPINGLYRNGNALQIRLT